MKNFEFKLFNTTWKVKFVDKVNSRVEPENGLMYNGMTCGDRHEIEVATKNLAGNTYSESEQKIVLYHEIFHAIFQTGSYMSSNDDEPLVEWCANCLYSLIEQRVL